MFKVEMVAEFLRKRGCLNVSADAR